MRTYFVQYQDSGMTDLMIVTGDSFDDVRDALPATTIAVWESDMSIDDERIATIERGVKAYMAANRIV